VLFLNCSLIWGLFFTSECIEIVWRTGSAFPGLPSWLQGVGPWEMEGIWRIGGCTPPIFETLLHPLLVVQVQIQRYWWVSLWRICHTRGECLSAGLVNSQYTLCRKKTQTCLQLQYVWNQWRRETWSRRVKAPENVDYAVLICYIKLFWNNFATISLCYFTLTTAAGYVSNKMPI